jgi:deazaflavin-dependent oxidoreductase (nitroreductase family)
VLVDERIRQAIATDRTIDITTIGRRSGEPRRIEIWRYRVDGRTFLSGTPGARDWYANLVANPDFTYHLKGTVTADLPARARPITQVGERREVIEQIIGGLGRAEGEVEHWVAESPLIEVEFRDS